MTSAGRTGTTQQRLLDLLDLICRDSLESPLGVQEPEWGEVSAWFAEARDLIKAMAE